jgi:hypothetical protein
MEPSPLGSAWSNGWLYPFAKGRADESNSKARGEMGVRVLIGVGINRQARDQASLTALGMADDISIGR